jgi:hypothetical protein
LSTKLFVLASLLVVAAQGFATSSVFEGGWNDGTKMEWSCPGDAQGKIPFRITLPSGQKYQGILNCGVSV